MQDLKYAFRILRKSPGFAAVAILVLALGIGANVAVFSLIDSLFLRPLPVDRPGELSQIESIDKIGRVGGIPSQVLEALRKEPLFRGLCGFTTPRLTADINGAARSIGALAMTGDCFSTLGVHMQIGRGFNAGDDNPNGERVVVLTDLLWRSDFAASPSVLGQKIQIDKSLFTVIGVAEPRFRGLLLGFPPGFVIPLTQTPLDFVVTPNRPVYFWVSIFCRRAPGVTQQMIQNRIDVLRQQLLEASVPHRYNEAQRRDYFARKLTVAPASTGVDWMLRSRFGEPLYAVFAICASVLLIACVNLTTLLLARGLRRQKEIGIRLALGASRASIVRLFALESSVLVLLASIAGLAVASLARQAILSQAVKIYALSLNESPDARTSLFFVILVLLIAAALIVAPALQIGRGSVRSSTRTQKILLAVQVALTLALIAGSSFFASSMKNLDDMNVGMRTEGLSEAFLNPLPGGYGYLPRGPYYRELLQRIENLRNVASASLTDSLPLWSKEYLGSVSAVENIQARSDLRAQAMMITPGFFDTVGIRVVSGEGFRESSAESEEPTAIVSESLAEQFGGAKLIGQHIHIESYPRLRVVGIASNALFSLEHPEQTKPFVVYMNAWQHPSSLGYLTLMLRTSGNALNTGDLNRVVASLHREYVQHYLTLNEAKDDALVENRLLAWLSTAFSILALILAAIGLFGLLSYHVASRTKEIGIRMALGAERLEIRRLVLAQLAPVMAAGIGIGLAFTVALGRVFAGLVYGVSVHDPGLITLSIAALLLTAVFAAWIPAGKASSVDPLIALRHD